MKAADWSDERGDEDNKKLRLPLSAAHFAALGAHGATLSEMEVAGELHHRLGPADFLLARKACKQRHDDNAADKLQFFLTFLLRYVVLAPSSRNSQPWHWRIQDNTLELFADQRRCLPVTDPHGRELLMSCGAALFYARLAMRHFGYACHVEYLPNNDNPDFLARISIGEPQPASFKEEDLFYAIARRHTNRGAFCDEPLPVSVMEQLQSEAKTEDSWLQVVDGFTLEGAAQREKISDLVVRGAVAVLRDSAVRREWAMWMRGGHSTRRDGLPPEALGVHPGKAWLTPLAWRYLDVSEQQADRNGELAATAPAICILGTRSNTPRAWLRAGEALARVLLRGATVGLSASFFNEPLREPTIASQLKQLCKYDGYGQVMFRMGVPAHETPATPRRPVTEVLVD